jgi:TPR repeat protein
MQWYHKAAQLGHAQAQIELAKAYEAGTGGLFQSDKKSMRWALKAAEQGNAQGQYFVSRCYEEGAGTLQNPNQAAHWLQKSANLGYVEAQVDLARAYRLGLSGLPADKEKSFHWYEKAAQQGDAPAQANLAACYLNGDGVRQNSGKAAYWNYKSAVQGCAGALINLGGQYLVGNGVPSNRVLSYALIKLGLAHYKREEKAVVLPAFNQLKEQLSNKEIEQGNGYAAKWTVPSELSGALDHLLNSEELGIKDVSLRSNQT